jgi:hypothetical protein
MLNNIGVEALYYGHTDNQGSLIALTDVNGNLAEKYAYDPLYFVQVCKFAVYG